LNKILKAYYESALALKLPVTCIDAINCLNIFLGGRNYLLLRGITQLNNASSIFVSKNKRTINSIFQDSGIPVPKSKAIRKTSFQKNPLIKLIPEIKFPVVAKPALNTDNGRDVLCNIKNIEDLADYLERMFKKHTYMLIEEYQTGLKEYQILLLNNRIINIIEFTAPTITGDGQNTIEQLIALKYRPLNKEDSESLSGLNDDCINCLKDQGLSLKHVLNKDEIIKIQNAVNRPLGGRTHAVDKHILRKNSMLIRQAAKITGLNLVGLDIMCEDINQSFSHSKWQVLEANFAPDITLHESPNEGNPIKVSTKILKQLIYQHPFAYLAHRLKLILGRETNNG
jgi:cyanophycin synthetase